MKYIDSIKKHVLTRKNLDSVFYANAQFIIGQQYRKTQMGDSAYYHLKKAEKIYHEKNAIFNLAEVNYEYAILQKNENDLTASELSSVEVLKLCDALSQSRDVIKLKADTYYNLAQVFHFLSQYEKSIEYVYKSMDLERSISDYNERSIEVSKNLLGITYQKAGQYQKALETFKSILDAKVIKTDDPSYYTTMDNYAYTKFLAKDTSGIPGLFFKALRSIDSLNPGGSYRVIIVNQHIAEYYQSEGKIDSALFYAYKAKEIADKFHRDEVLTSLKLLSKIETGDKALKYLNEYVRLNDSIQKEERALRNKSARIRYETKEKEQQLAEVSKERLWLLFISIGVILTSILIYIVITQRNKNKELKFIQEQQEANEEIYNLMLNQSDNIEEARAAEKKRISEELHDGVLGRLFGTRLSLDSLNMNNSPEAIKTRSQYIEGLKTIEQDIRKVSHELNTDFVSGGGFKDIIKTLVDTQCLAYGLKYTFTHDDDIDWDSIPNKTKIHFYRIIQETLHNIYKHAKASAVKINFKRENNNILLLLSDDGAGFDVTRAKSGIGLKNMNSRIKEIGGRINIVSEPGKGTTVTIEAPKN
ncbi:sensor histidine kinase [Gaetbulibacter aestuarii]|uniref:Oxygen sensor histidine kinase NreB n=1 Tax=Gaetbulibacter aestuarii TaxID=1502358 RepID=A0ABW7MW51_9FLAO